MLIHKLLERLPELQPGEREGRARDWLARQAADVPERSSARQCSRRSLAVLAAPGWAEIFSPAALAEVPLAATVGGQVIAGTADRLLVERDRVLVVDFKTARRPPSGLSEVPLTTLRANGGLCRRLGRDLPGTADRGGRALHAGAAARADSGQLLEEHKAGLVAIEESFAG